MCSRLAAGQLVPLRKDYNPQDRKSHSRVSLCGKKHPRKEYGYLLIIGCKRCARALMKRANLSAY